MAAAVAASSPPGAISLNRQLEPEANKFDLDCRADHQKQQDAHQRRIWVSVILLRTILHDRTSIRISYAPARGEPIPVMNMQAAA
jgi:hypothetical protein